MNIRLPFRTIKGQLILWFLVIAFTPLVLFGIIVYRQRTEIIKAEAFAKLQAVRDLKVQRINDWLDEISSDVETIAADTRTLLAPAGTLPLRAGAATMQTARENLNNHLRSRPVITEIQIIDPVTGKILISTDRQHDGEDRSSSPNLREPLRTKKLFIGDIHHSTITNRRRMNFAMPALLPGPAATVAAVIVVDIDMQMLDGLLGERTGLGETGETLVVNRDVVAVNELRWSQNAPLRLKIEAAPSIRAAQGQTGVIEAPDYRGVPVLAAHTYIPRTSWGFVAKQDQAELYAPIALLQRTMLLLFPICLALVWGLAAIVARFFSRALRQMQATADALRAGDLTARNSIERSDELGSLARAFNEMAVTMESQMAVDTGNRHILGAMVVPTTVAGFCGELLPVIMRATRSDMGAFYLPAGDGTLAPAAAMGLSREALQPFDAARLEGAIGAALSSREVRHLREIPPDTRFTFRTIAGTAVPREMLTIPVLVKDQVVALIALAALREYPPEALAVVKKSLVAFGIGFANILAGEETRRLAAELSSRNAELQDQKDELQSQTVELESLTVEQQKQADTLQEQNTELEVQTTRVAEANRLKSEFLSNMSHELRTPLNSVLALSRVLLLQAKERLSAEEAGYLEIIERNGKHLLSLINDILDLAKIEAGRMDVSSEEFSLGEKIGVVAESLEPLCREKGIALKVDVEPGLPLLLSDGRRVHQILQNIIGNAVKFTRAGHVTVAVHRRGEEVEIAVTDTGIGIPERDLPSIFDEFRQVDGTSSRSFEGTGLGLAIAARSARLLGGRITVASTLGTGSTFTISLPLKIALPQVRPVAAAAAVPPTPAAATVGERRIVLVVDDDPHDAGLIAGSLTREGYEVVTARSGKEALRLAEVRRPFAITLDVVMPEMDGWEVLQELKRNPATSAIPVIIVSISEDRETGLALGAIGVVAKPVDRETLLAEVRRVAPRERAVVLVTDDKETDRRIMTKMLAAEGFEVRQAKDGAECLATIGERLPDVVLLDLMMPGMSGFEVLDQLRNDHRTRQLPVIIVTAHELSAREREHLQCKVAAVVEKSRLASGDLLTEIGRIMERIGKLPAAAAPGNRLLLVEDSEPAITQVRTILQAAGYHLDVARGGEEALERMAAAPPDGIILDLMMPGMDGLTTLERMRGTPATARTPVLILTAKDLTPEDLARLSANNVQQLIQKGDVDREQLLHQVARLLGREMRAVPRCAQPPSHAALPRRAAGTQQLAGVLPRILAVEDNPDNMSTLRAILKGRCTLLEAGDGGEGLRLALELRPDLVLLDMSLPTMDGLAVLERLRQDPATLGIPVIALTAHAMKGDREKLLAAGYDDYVSKPIEVEKFLETIVRWLGPSDDSAGGGRM